MNKLGGICIDKNKKTPSSFIYKKPNKKKTRKQNAKPAQWLIQKEGERDTDEITSYLPLPLVLNKLHY